MVDASLEVALLLLALFAAVPGVLAAWWYVVPFVGFFL